MIPTPSHPAGAPSVEECHPAGAPSVEGCHPAGAPKARVSGPSVLSAESASGAVRAGCPEGTHTRSLRSLVRDDTRRSLLRDDRPRPYADPYLTGVVLGL